MSYTKMKEQLPRPGGQPVDFLPDLPDLVQAVNDLADNDKALRYHDGDGVDTMWEKARRRNSAFQQEFFSAFKGANRIAEAKRFFHYFRHKDALIETLQVLQDMYNRANVSKDFGAFLDTYKPMWQQRYSPGGNTTHTQTAAKLVAIASWMAFNTFPPGYDAEGIWNQRGKVLLHPPHGSLIGCPHGQFAIYRCAMKAMHFDESPLDGDQSRTMAPEWMTLNCPVLSATKFYVEKWCVRQNVVQVWLVDTVFAELLDFLSMLIAKLRSDLDMVTMAQAKLMGGAATVAFAAISRLQQYQQISVAHNATMQM